MGSLDPYSDKKEIAGQQWFQIVPAAQYGKLQEILKERLPESLSFYNSVQLALTGTTDMVFFTYEGSLSAESIILSAGSVKGKEPNSSGIPMAFLCMPKGTNLQPHVANHFISQFQSDLSNHTPALFVSTRNITPVITRELLNVGSVVNIRSCDIYKLNEDKFCQRLRVKDLLEQNPITMCPLTAESSNIVEENWHFGLWNDTFGYVNRCIQNNPTAGVFVAGELCSWGVCYDFGWAGMLFTPEAHRGKGYGNRAMTFIVDGMKARGLVPITGVEPRNIVSSRLMRRIGFEKTHEMDFIFSS